MKLECTLLSSATSTTTKFSKTQACVEQQKTSAAFPAGLLCTRSPSVCIPSASCTAAAAASAAAVAAAAL
jgi:hypothetical protein